MDTNSNPNRVIVFIDGNNFYYKMKDMTSNKSEVIKLLDFKYSNFAQNLIKGDTLIEIRYYVGAVKRQAGPDKEKSEKLYSNQQKLIAKLQQQKVAVILGNLIQHPDRSFHEKGVDVRLAVEMIRFAREDKYDVAYLLSSDTDLVPAVEEVHSFNKKVVYVGLSKGQSFGLTKASDNTILLRDEDVLPYIPCVHSMKLQQIPFEQIKNGNKTIETRLNDEKRQLVKIGDEIEFALHNDKNQRLKAKVLEIMKFATFEELFDACSASDFGAKDKNDFLTIKKIYSDDEQNKYGVLGIRLQVI